VMTGIEIALLAFGVWLFVLTFYVWVGLASKVDLHRQFQTSQKEYLEEIIEMNRKHLKIDIESLERKDQINYDALVSEMNKFSALLKYLDLEVRNCDEPEIVKKGKK
jgi:hypothetical protein